jgi:hypothetical protein
MHFSAKVTKQQKAQQEKRLEPHQTRAHPTKNGKRTQVVMIIHDFSLVPWTRPLPKPCPTVLDFTSSSLQLLYSRAQDSTLTHDY